MFILNWLVKGSSQNQARMEKNKIRRINQEGAFDEAAGVTKKKKMNLVSELYDKVQCPLKDMEVAYVLNGMCAVVEMRPKMDMPHGYFEHDKPLSTGVQDCIQALVQLKPSKLKSVLHGTWRKTVSWHHRAAGAFLYLHPLIYGKGGVNHRFDKVSKVLGVDECTVRKWFSLHDGGSKRHM
jgi:hypothetical protein